MSNMTVRGPSTAFAIVAERKEIRAMTKEIVTKLLIALIRPIKLCIFDGSIVSWFENLKKLLVSRSSF